MRRARVGRAGRRGGAGWEGDRSLMLASLARLAFLHAWALTRRRCGLALRDNVDDEGMRRWATALGPETRQS